LIKSNHWNLIEVFGESNKFQYLHGVEMEYFLQDSNFQPMNDNNKFKKLIEETYKIIEPKIRNSEYSKKVINIGIGTEEILRSRTNKKDFKKLKTIFVEIEQKNYDNFKSDPIDIVGKDTNIGTGSFITLELVTPPCSSVKELKWWLETILFSTYAACNKLGMKFFLLAGHPEIDKNYCGEHHHIGVKDIQKRIKIYNVLRLFLPYLSILSYSYFENPGNKNIDIQDDIFKTKISNQFIRCCRLKNTNQIKPIAPQNSLNKRDFAKNINSDINSCRMVDMYPFTDYNTLEIRIFDTQISLARTIAMAIILQGLCQLALEIDDKIVDVLNKVLPKNHYEALRIEFINKGFNSIQSLVMTRLYHSFQNEIKSICTLCQKNQECNYKDIQDLKCTFKIENELYHNLIAFLLFPRRFIYQGKMYGDLHKKITTKDSIKQILYLIKPFLIKMNLSQSICLKVIDYTLKAGFEPSMYWLIQYKKNQENPKQFYNELIEFQNKLVNKETIWGGYYDPFMEFQ